MLQTFKQLSRSQWFLIIIVIAGTFLRLHRLEDTLMFQSDQARDAIVVKRMIKDGDLTLLGPVTSVGNLYLGPFYYYFMAPFLALSYPNPVGPAIAVALLNSLTIYLIYRFGKDMLSQPAAIIAAALFAISAVGIEYSRFSWNPNLAPLFALLIIYGLYKLYHHRSIPWLVITFASAAVLIQLHYVAALIFPVIAVSIGITLWKQQHEKQFMLALLATTLGSAALVIVPLLAFDATHNWIITSSFLEFLNQDQAILSPTPQDSTIIKASQGRLFLTLTQLITATREVLLDRVLSYTALAVSIIFAIKEFQTKKRYSVFLIFLSITIAVIGLSFLSSSVFYHYILYLLPIVSLFYGWIGAKLWRAHWAGKLATIGFICAIAYLNAPHWQTFHPAPQQTKEYYQKVADQIYPLTSTGRYNIASITESRDFLAMPYRYYLEVTDNPPEHQDDIFDLDQLIIVDEVNTAMPLSHPAAVIAHPAQYLNGIQETVEIESGLNIYVVE